MVVVVVVDVVVVVVVVVVVFAVDTDCCAKKLRRGMCVDGLIDTFLSLTRRIGDVVQPPQCFLFPEQESAESPTTHPLSCFRTKGVETVEL
jgi:hypothetical protein